MEYATASEHKRREADSKANRHAIVFAFFVFVAFLGTVYIIDKAAYSDYSKHVCADVYGLNEDCSDKAK